MNKIKTPWGSSSAGNDSLFKIVAPQSSSVAVAGVFLAATVASLEPENTEYVHRYENGVHTWEPKKVAR